MDCFREADGLIPGKCDVELNDLQVDSIEEAGTFFILTAPTPPFNDTICLRLCYDHESLAFLSD